MKTHVRTLGIAAVMTLAAAGCSPKSAVVAPEVKDKLYSVSPDTLMVKAGIVTGQVSEMKVTERVEEGSGRIATPAKLTGKLVLKNVSSDQTVRLLGGKILYMDMQGKLIKLEDSRTAPTIKVPTSYGSSDRLDPGQESTHTLDAEFPVEALKAKALKQIRVELSYIPSQFKEETLSFGVAIGGQ
jgi:hypothetical protein